MRITAASDFIDSSTEIIETIAFWYRKSMNKEDVRDRFKEERDKAIRAVSEHPEIGRGGPEGRIVSFLFRSRMYVVLYRIEDDVIVLRDIADGKSRTAARWRGY